MSLLDELVAEASYKVNFVCLGSVVVFFLEGVKMEINPWSKVRINNKLMAPGWNVIF